MRFHVVSLPHTQTTKEYLSCAYTQKVIKFCEMMMSLGHEVYIYASSENIAPCSEHIICITKERQLELLNGVFYVNCPFNPLGKIWVEMNTNAIIEIRKRKKEKDFLCLIAGRCQQQIADSLPDMMAVEWGIGYGGVFAKYKVFESYSWMHTVYGSMNSDPHSLNGNFYDTVIHNSFKKEDFPFRDKKEDYFLYIGRINERKGIQIAIEACKRAEKRLIMAGAGNPPDGVEYVGVVDEKLRGELMSKAIAVFVPTIYIEPFGGVAIEAHLCGTPTITTDWGAFTETVINGFNGYRCRTLSQFVDAMGDVSDFSPKQYKDIRNHAVKTYSIYKIRYQYEEYFKTLLTLYGDGWYSK